MLFDSHAHLTDDELFKDLDLILSNARKVQVDSILCICTGPLSLERALELKKKEAGIYVAAAVHPHDAMDRGDSFYPIVQKAAFEGKLSAIGEIGLDYHYDHSPKDVQQSVLRSFLKLAQKTHLPISVHCREAFADFFSIFDEVVKDGPMNGVMHCFTGAKLEAEESLKRGFYISISGVATFPKSIELRETIKGLPLDRLLVETDAPYLAPPPFRGKRCEPAYVKMTAEIVAQIKGLSLEDFAKATSDNAKKLLNIS